MPTEPTNNQPVIPFPTPNFTPVLDGPSHLVPESAAFMNLQLFLTEKANLEFIPVKARSLEQRTRLVFVRQQCAKLEKQVVLERMVAQIACLRQEIKALKARPRKHGRKPAQNDAHTRKQRLANREAIAAKQAELSKLEVAQAQLSGISTVNELHELTRNQFLKMVGMTVLALTIWNEAVAGGSEDGGSSASLGNGSLGMSWNISGSYSSSSGAMMDDCFIHLSMSALDKTAVWAGTMERQELENWCWAAICVGLGHLYGTLTNYRRQCDLALAVFPISFPDCCNDKYKNTQVCTSVINHNYGFQPAIKMMKVYFYPPDSGVDDKHPVSVPQSISAVEFTISQIVYALSVGTNSRVVVIFKCKDAKTGQINQHGVIITEVSSVSGTDCILHIEDSNPNTVGSYNTHFINFLATGPAGPDSTAGYVNVDIQGWFVTSQTHFKFHGENSNNY